MRLGPGPNLPKELAIEPGTAQVMQQTRNLIQADPLGSMAQRRGHRCAHTRSPHCMRPIVPTDDTATVSRVRVIVKRHELRHKRTGNQERSTS